MESKLATVADPIRNRSIPSEQASTTTTKEHQQQHSVREPDDSGITSRLGSEGQQYCQPSADQCPSAGSPAPPRCLPPLLSISRPSLLYCFPFAPLRHTPLLIQPASPCFKPPASLFLSCNKDSSYWKICQVNGRTTFNTPVHPELSNVGSG